MTRPITSQPISRSQLGHGNENISIRHMVIPRIGTTGTIGQRNGRSASGLVRRMTSTAEQTTVNANSVPIFVISSRASIGNKPAPTDTNNPIRIVVFQGVRNRGWTSPKNPGGTSPSRAIARNTRGAESIITSNTDVIPATPAHAIITSAHCRPTDLNAIDTPAPVSMWLYLTIPVSTITTSTYRTVQMRREATIPIGTSRLGRLASSACVETESNPMYAKKIIAAPASMPTGLPPTVSPQMFVPKMLSPPQPYGAKGFQLSALM